MIHFVATEELETYLFEHANIKAFGLYHIFYDVTKKKATVMILEVYKSNVR